MSVGLDFNFLQRLLGIDHTTNYLPTGRAPMVTNAISNEESKKPAIKLFHSSNPERTHTYTYTFTYMKAPRGLQRKNATLWK